MSAGVALPKKVFGHGFLLNNGEKMSKSLGNVESPFGMAEEYGVDQVRYYCLRMVASGRTAVTAIRISSTTPTPIWPIILAISHNVHFP